MVHWAFLIPAFFAGFVSCYMLLRHLAKVYSQVISAIDEGAKKFRGWS